MLPVLFIIGLAIAGLKLGEKLRPRDVVGATNLRRLPARPRISQVALLNAIMARGERPSRFLVAAATREAYDQGDWNTVGQIYDVFHSDESAPETKEEPAPEKQEPAPATVQSPLESVSPDDWQAFCHALDQKPHTHHTDRHHGRFEHNLGRLRQLGIDPPKTAEEQEQALAADMVDYWNTQAKLIADYSGDVVDVDGQQHAVTASGVLGLLKAAGPQGAASWLANPEDRRKFPHTTGTFINTNGCF